MKIFNKKKICKGINFWIEHNIHNLKKSEINEILINHLWKGGIPILKTILKKINNKNKFFLKNKYKNKKTKNLIETILWEIKYLILNSELKIYFLLEIIGKILIIFISNLSQIKNNLEEIKEKKNLKIINIKKPKNGDKNNINLKKIFLINVFKTFF